MLVLRYYWFIITCDQSISVWATLRVARYYHYIGEHIMYKCLMKWMSQFQAKARSMLIHLTASLSKKNWPCHFIAFLDVWSMKWMSQFQAKARSMLIHLTASLSKKNWPCHFIAFLDVWSVLSCIFWMLLLSLLALSVLLLILLVLIVVVCFTCNKQQ